MMRASSSSMPGFPWVDVQQCSDDLVHRARARTLDQDAQSPAPACAQPFFQRVHELLLRIEMFRAQAEGAAGGTADLSDRPQALDAGGLCLLADFGMQARGAL